MQRFGDNGSPTVLVTVYNPAEYRWPLAISLSADGLDYNTLNLVDGGLTPERHGGNYKNQVRNTRGIQGKATACRDSNLWVAYSMNKEGHLDVTSRCPVRLAATSQADENFTRYKQLAGHGPTLEHSFSIVAPVSLDGKWLKLSDRDPYDYARVERVIPATRELRMDFDIRASQNHHGQMDGVYGWSRHGLVPV